MKHVALALVGACVLAAPVAAQRTTRVDGYVRKDGTYVAPHVRTAPNGTTSDNYSTRGNTNPYTGRAGTVDPYKPYSGSSSSSSSTSSSTRTRGF